MSIFGKKKENAEDGTVLLKMTVGKNDRLKVDTVFDHVRFRDVKDAVASYAEDFLNETYGVSDLKGNGARELVSIMAAAVIASFDSEVDRVEMLENIRKNVEFFALYLRRKQ